MHSFVLPWKIQKARHIEWNMNCVLVLRLSIWSNDAIRCKNGSVFLAYESSAYKRRQFTLFRQDSRIGHEKKSMSSPWIFVSEASTSTYLRFKFGKLECFLHFTHSLFLLLSSCERRKRANGLPAILRQFKT